jgi:hypothetical protein
VQNLKRIIFISCFLLSNYLISGACDDYPYSHGDIDVLINTEEEIKILATAGEAIQFDGVAGIVEAHKIAELNAKVIIAEFIEVEIRKKNPDEGVTLLMKGVKKVDTCVQDKEYPRMVMVTVGISSSYSKL